MTYRSVARSVEGFVQQIACCYLRHGYRFYVAGKVPGRKDPASVDRKLIAKYGIDVSESTRIRRKRDGLANLQYIRHGRFFAILATAGEHRFYADEGERVRDIRREPLRYAGYSISYRRGGRKRDGTPDEGWHAHVRIDRRPYQDLRDALVEGATRQGVQMLAMAFYSVPYEPYAPVRRQLLRILAAVNLTRRRAGLGSVPVEAIPMKRRIVRPFAEP